MNAAGERLTHQTLHLTAAAVWSAQAGGLFYLPEAYAADGFIHCTDGDAELIAVANRYYRGDRRAFVVLTIALNRVSARVVYEDAQRKYPHIYGHLEVAAVAAVRRVVRTTGGAFVGLEA
jgi:uncharacterized protein (DUF952 family)